MIKKILVCFIVLFSFSCSTDYIGVKSYQEFLPVESINMPLEFQLGLTHEINLTYLKPTNCHSFNGIYYLTENNERTVAIINTVFQGNGNCETYDVFSSPVEQASFNFSPTELGYHLFKFWQGTGDNGQDIYLTEEVLVVE